MGRLACGGEAGGDSSLATGALSLGRFIGGLGLGESYPTAPGLRESVSVGV